MGLQALPCRAMQVVVGLKLVIDTADANVVIDTGALHPDIKRLILLLMFMLGAMNRL